MFSKARRILAAAAPGTELISCGRGRLRLLKIQSFGVEDEQDAQYRDEAGPEIGYERFLPEAAIVEKLGECQSKAGHRKPEMLVLDFDHGFGHNMAAVRGVSCGCRYHPRHLMPHAFV